MGVEYGRSQRESIYHTAAIGDIPFEVIQKSFLLLGNADLVSVSLSCRAWRQAAAELFVIDIGFKNEQKIEKVVCGMLLKSIVSGLSHYSIKTVFIDVCQVGVEHIASIISVAPTLSSLALQMGDDNEDLSPTYCYGILEYFFSECPRIRNLKLLYFDFGDDLASLTSTIKSGFTRLNSLVLIHCGGDLVMFAENAPIPKLSKISYWSNEDDTKIAFISTLAMNSHALKSISIDASRVDSWECIHKIVEFCRNLEILSISDYSFRPPPLKHPLVLADLKAISTLPLLKSLNLFQCWIVKDAQAPLAAMKGLRSLRGVRLGLLRDVLPSIGGKLVSLVCGLQSYGLQSGGERGIKGIVEHCPNLEYLNIGGVSAEDLSKEDKEKIVGIDEVLKKELKKLARLVFFTRNIRLGTDLHEETTGFFRKI
jgi:hypothetical protein